MSKDYMSFKDVFKPKYIVGVGVVHDVGTTVPTDGDAGYATACIFQKTDGSNVANFYVNNGDVTSALFELVNPQAASSATGRGLSPDIWDTCPVEQYKNNLQDGVFFLDDFIDGIDIATNLAVAVVSALGTTGVWTGATDTTANTVKSITTDRKGAVILSTDTDNESAMIVHPKGAAVAGKYQFSAGKQFWMEARIKVSGIADTLSQLYVGFAEEALIAGGSLLTTSEGGLADKDYVGFVREYADGDKMNTNFNTASGGSSPVSNSNAVTLAATTYTKIGMYSDGTTLTFFQDGVALPDVFLLAATDFPLDEEMAFYIENMCGAAGTVNTLTVDWVAIAQEY